MNDKTMLDHNVNDDHGLPCTKRSNQVMLEVGAVAHLFFVVHVLLVHRPDHETTMLLTSTNTGTTCVNLQSLSNITAITPSLISHN